MTITLRYDHGLIGLRRFAAQRLRSRARALGAVPPVNLATAWTGQQVLAPRIQRPCTDTQYQRRSGSGVAIALAPVRA